MARTGHYVRPVVLVDHNFHRLEPNNPDVEFFHIYMRSPVRDGLELVQQFSKRDFKAILEFLDLQLAGNVIDEYGFGSERARSASDMIFREFEIVSLPAAIAIVQFWTQSYKVFHPEGI